jgi:site-specific DNA recombinase
MAGRKPDVPAVRCAVYTRKSTEEGLEQEFNSLDAQRKAGEAYITSRRGEGWTCLPDRYDDGGYTGGQHGMPGLETPHGRHRCRSCRLRGRLQSRRMSRSLLDFTRNMEALEKGGVSFVSAMGRLTLNIPLSFA